MSKFKTMNTGEWSEVYAFLKILADAYLNGCDENLNLLEDKVEVLSIPKFQINTKAQISYLVNGKDILLQSQGTILAQSSRNLFKQKANELLDAIKVNTERTFKVDNISTFLQSFGNPVLKEKVASKRDITIKIFDSNLNISQALGFSIKSNLANASTLLNASAGTNFTYSVNVTEDEYKNLKELKAKALLNRIDVNNIRFEKVDSEIYANNLRLIDTQFSQIISFILLKYYQRKGTTILELLKILEDENPLKLPDIKVYTAKIEEFLLATVLGMVPKTLWDRRYNADGGMIIVKEDGNIATFYIYKREFLFKLMKYLLNHTFLDTPSVTRHKFGKLEKTKNSYSLKLNLQIRIR